MKNKILLLFFHAIFGTILFSQQQNITLNREMSLEFDRALLYNDSNTIATNFRPLNENIKNYFSPFSQTNRKYNLFISSELIQLGNNCEHCCNYYYCHFHSGGLFHKKISHQNLIVISDTSQKFRLTIDPLFNFEFGKDLKDSSNEKLYKNTRGILVKGDIGNKLSFESSFYENQATFVQYVDNFTNKYKIIPGQGRWKDFKKNGYDFAMASAHVSFSPNKYFNFQGGHGKHFVGDGYRSLLLSDNSFNYPYLRITSSYKKLQYTNLYAVFMNLTPGEVMTPPNTEPLFQKKAASFQMLSWNILKNIQLGLFQGMIWQAADDRNKQHLNFYYFNPILYTNVIKYSLNSTNNILLGSTVKVKVSKSVHLYGQYLQDDIAKRGEINNKTGFQIGVRAFDLLKLENLHAQIEYNQLNPYSFSAKKIEQNYSHYNQPLSHPLQANFKEFITLLNYRFRNFFSELKLIYAIIGTDSINENFGNSIFLSNNNAYYGISSTNNKLGQGITETLTFKDFKIGYIVNPSTNLNIILGITNRIENFSNNRASTNFIYFGIRTSLTNTYYDF